MLRLENDRPPSLWESVLPPQLFEMSEEEDDVLEAALQAELRDTRKR